MSATAYDAAAVTTERSAQRDDKVPTEGISEGDEVTVTYQTRLGETNTVTGTVAYGGRDTHPTSGGLRGHRIAVDADETTYTLYTRDLGDGRVLEMRENEGHDASVAFAD